MAANDPAFVDVTVVATGEQTSVPADWLDPSFPQAHLFERVPVAKDPVDPGEAPTERNTVEEIDTFAAEHGIDLGDAGTKAEKVAVINDALVAALPPAAPEVPPGNPDVQTVAGQASTEPMYPYLQESAQTDVTTETTGGTASSDENPASPDKEN